MASVTIFLPDKEAKLGCGFDSSCRVTKVQPGGLADQHQVAAGFVLISINGRDCSDITDINEIKEQLKDRPVTLLLAPEEALEAEQPDQQVESSQKDPDSQKQPANSEKEPADSKKETAEGVITLTAVEGGLGFGVSSLPPAEKLFVKKVDPGSWAAQHGLKEGFQLLQVQGKDAGSLSADEFRSAMKLQRPLELSFVPSPVTPSEEQNIASPPEPADAKASARRSQAAEESPAPKPKAQEAEESPAPKPKAQEAEESPPAPKPKAQEAEESPAPKPKAQEAEESPAPKPKAQEAQESPAPKPKAQEAEAVQKERGQEDSEDAQVATLKKKLAESTEELQKAQAELSEARRQAQLKELEEQEKASEKTAHVENDFATRVWESAEVRDLKRQVELEIQTLRSELEMLKSQVGSMRNSVTELPATSSFQTPGGEATVVGTEDLNDGSVNLFRAAQPLLRQNTEKRSQAVQAVEAALQKGASPNSWQGPGSPLQAAVQARAPDLVKCLLKAHADPGEIDAHGVSLLHLATFHGEVEVSKLLLEANANPNVTDRYAQTPLFFAPTRQMCMTLHNFKADVNATNSKGQSPLHLAAKAGLGDVMHWLAAKAHPDALATKDAHGQRVADYAKAAGLRNMVGKLEGRGKSPRTPTASSASPTRAPCGVASPQESRLLKAPFRLSEPSK